MKKVFIFLCAVLLFVLVTPFSAFAVNTAPVVIPNIQQWTGGTGTFHFPEIGRICYDEDALATTADVLKDDLADFTNIAHTVVKTSSPAAGDIFLTLNCSDSTIGMEGYLMTVDNYTAIIANADAGAFYGTRTLLQILKQDPAHANIPNGSIKDFPKYKERGFMLDVARKYFTPQYLENYIRQMAWLKLNDFHLHFTDDQGFRLKSDSYPNLSFDQGYSKQYLRTLQDIAAKYHVTITPEIDLPGHASAVVKAYPETGHAPGTSLNSSKEGLRPIDLSKDASWDIAYGLLDEFVPLFDAPDFHIGGDEYPGYGTGATLNNLLINYPDMLTKAQSMGLQTEADLYYKFLNSMGDYVETNYGKKARFWEWPERFEPYTSIDIDNDMIFDAWEGPEAVNRSAQGFKIINSNWKSTYIVPGTNMYPDMQTLYEQWQPNWLDLTGTIQLAANDPNLLGAKFHNWNDYAGAYNEGGLDRFTLLPLKVFAEDIWGAPRRASLTAFKTEVNALGNAPGHGVDLVGAWKFEENSGNTTKDTSGYTKTATINGSVRTTSGKYGSALVFDGVDDTVNISEPDINGSWTVSTWVNRTASITGNAIIMDSENASIKLEQVGSANVGFTNKTTSTDYTFNYNAPVGQWVNLTFVGNASQTILYVNGVLNQTIAAGIKCPMDTLGSSTNSMNGTLDEVKVYARELDSTAIASLQNGMLMYMPFEDSDQTIALDTSGSLYHGVIKSPTERTESGKEGKGILLSNRNSEIVLCHDDVSGPWTTSIWVNKAAGSLGGPLLRSYLSAISIGSTGIPKLTVHGVADYSFTTAIDEDVWTNLTFTSDGVSQTSLYVNGEYKETINNTISLPLMTLGYWWQAFDGKVDELKVYDRALSSAEIKDMVGYSPWIGELTTNSVQLLWNNVTGATGYNVYRSSSPDSGYVKINASVMTDTGYFDFGLTSGNTYYYKLTYELSGVESSQSGKETVAVPAEVLLSLNKPATAQNSTTSHGPELANDSSASTYWDGSSAPKWWRIDLLDQYDLTKLVITNYTDGTRYYQYNIQSSTDGFNWVQLVEKNRYQYCNRYWRSVHREYKSKVCKSQYDIWLCR